MVMENITEIWEQLPFTIIKSCYGYTGISKLQDEEECVNASVLLVEQDVLKSFEYILAAPLRGSMSLRTILNRTD